MNPANIQAKIGREVDVMNNRFSRGMELGTGERDDSQDVTIHALPPMSSTDGPVPSVRPMGSPPPMPPPPMSDNGDGLVAPSAEVEFDQELGATGQEPPKGPESTPKRRDRFSPTQATPAIKVPRRLDETVIDATYVATIDLLTWIRSWYYMARSWIVHHRWGQVSLQTYYKRRKHCLHCDFRQLITGDDGKVREFCRHDTCGCGTKPNPITGDYPDIEHKAALVNWECPLPGADKRFGLGRAVTDPELDMVQVGVENRHGKQSVDREH